MNKMEKKIMNFKDPVKQKKIKKGKMGKRRTS